MLLKHVANAFAASRNWDSASLGRLAFWVEQLGERDFMDITTDEVDECLVRLAERGKLRAGCRVTERTGLPLKGSTLNRYQTTYGQLAKFARKARLVPRNFVSPLRGIEKAPEPIDPDRWLRVEQVERIIACARVVDKRWRRLPALVMLALHTGLRRGSLLSLKWENVDLPGRRLLLGRTKNGAPIGCVLTERCAAELERLPNKEPQSLVFANRFGRPFAFKNLWAKSCSLAGLAGRNFHQLRHGCGSALALGGANQAQIMLVLGHKTLSASQRYMHMSVHDQRAVVDKVFG